MAKTSWKVCGVVLVLTAACGSSEKHDSPNQGDAAAAGAEDMGGGSGGGAGTNDGTAGTNGGAGNGGGAGAMGGSATRGGAGGAGAMGGTLAHGGSSGQGGGGAAGQSTGGAASGGSAGGGAGGTQSAGGMAGAPPDETLTSCATWKVERSKDSTGTAELVEGGVLLTLPAGTWSRIGPFNNAGIALSQSGLTGDFDVVVSFDELEPSDGVPFVGPKFQAGVWQHAENGNIWQGIGDVGQQTAKVTTVVWSSENMLAFNTEPVDHPVVDDDAWLVGASGTIEISRQGTSLTATITVNGESATFTPPDPFDAEPLDLFLSLGNADEDYGKTDASVRITSVTVTGDGVMSDTFDCAP